MLYYPEGMNKWAYVEAVAKKYKHDKKALAEKIKELKNEKTITTGNLF